MFTEIQQTTNVTYAGISNGRIVVKVPEGTEKATARINKAGNKVYEKFFASISGTIKAMTIEESTYEKQVRIYLERDNTFAVLSFKFDSAYGRSFFNQIFNVDFSKEITFTPWMKISDDGTKINRLYLNQGKEKVNSELPSECPSIKWIKRGEKSILDTASKLDNEEWIEENFKKLVSDNSLTWKPKDGDIKLERELYSEPENKSKGIMITVGDPLTKEEVIELENRRKKAKKNNSDTDDLDDLFN